MLIFVKVNQLDYRLGDKAKKAQIVADAYLQKVINSGKLVLGGAFTETPGGFFILEADSTNEISQLFKTDFSAYKVEMHHLTGYKKLEELFHTGFLT